MRRLWVYILLAALAFGAGLFTSRALNSPYWALYQIGRAVHNHDAQRFLAYVNLDRIVAGQGQQLPELMGNKEAGKLGGHLATLLQGLLPSLTAQIRAQVVRVVEDPKRENLASSFDLLLAANVTRNDNYALVVLSHPKEKLRLRMGMHRKEGSHWQVVHLDSRDLASLMKRYARDKADKATSTDK